MMEAEKSMGKRKQYLTIRHLLEDYELDQCELAQAVGMGVSTLSQRLNGASDWRKSEVLGICRELHIKQEDVGRVFYPELDGK
jgi:transcriptional regulator with XRE-family HTH domain